MRKLTLSLLVAVMIFVHTAHGQEQKTNYDTFIQHEIQTWNERIASSETHRGDENIDVKFYHLDIEIAIDSAYIKGNVLCVFSSRIDGLDNLELDLNNALTVTTISQPCESFVQSNEKIFINLSESFSAGDLVELNIEYEGEPIMPGGYKGLRYETHNGNEPIIATLSTPFLAHYWYPCKDGPEDKADSVYVDITIENKQASGLDFIALSNGLLEEVTSEGNYKTFKWRHRYPIVTYYVMAAISNYAKIEDEFQIDETRTMPLDYYVFGENYDDQLTGTLEIPDVLEFFNSVFGPYPFEMEKYGMTQLGYYGAIENQTNTIINSMSAANGWFMVSVHELGHMWFADMITCETWHDGWLNEGFATYSEALWVEHKEGMTAYSAYMESKEYFEEGTLYLEQTDDPFGVFRQIIYNKGAWALHMLRGVVGDTLFFEALLNYSTDTTLMYAHATTPQLKEIFEETSGFELDYFFEEWVYDEYYPIYYYNFDQLTDQKLYVSIYQAQQEKLGARPVFEMPLQINITFDDGSDSTVTVWNDEQFQLFEFNFEKIVDTVIIDKDNLILHEDEYDPELPVGLEENKQLSFDLIKVQPNPFNDKIELTSDASMVFPITFRLLDLSGRIMLEETIHQGNNSIITTNLPQGVYIYKLLNSNYEFVSSGKVLKK